jgi:GTP cyclohydrolase I
MTDQTTDDALVIEPDELPPGDVLTWDEIRMHARMLADRWRISETQREAVGWLTSVYGVPTGGAPVAVMVADLLGLPLVVEPIEGSLIVDDLVDTGATLAAYVAQGYDVDALYRKPWSPPQIAARAAQRDVWLRFPWEKDHGDPVDAVVRLLQFIGEDPTRDGLLDTPRRVVKAWGELTSGYRVDVAAVLSTTFEVPNSGDPVIVSRIPFTSMCEHHMLPFTGHATVAYLPGDRVVGLSKLARLVHAYARRLQVQERLTSQLTDALVAHLEPRGAAALVDGVHSCMSMRGVSVAATMHTTSFVGDLASVPWREHLARLHRG